MRAGAAQLALALALVCGCNDAKPIATNAPVPSSAALSPGIAARVADISIPTARVAALAERQNISLPSAREIAVRDALFAHHAKMIGAQTMSSLGPEQRGVLARALLTDVFREAMAQGPVSDAELATVTERHWLDLNRPEGFRVVHAVARADATRPEEVERAKALAEAILAVTRPLAERIRTSPPPGDGPDEAVKAFIDAAKAKGNDTTAVVAEVLSPVAADGRVLSPGGGRYDPDFAKAAATLTNRGDIAGPITTSFGVHILVLLDRTPPHVVPVEERRAKVHDEVMTERARAAEEKILEGLRGSVRVEGNVDALLELVPIEP